MLCERGGVPDRRQGAGLRTRQGSRRPNAGQRQLSEPGTLLGTPLYIAPEAITRPDQIDGRADLYAFGAVAYFLLTGTPPFPGVNILEICGMHLHLEPESPSQRLGRDLPPALDRLVLRCLAKDPDKRPRSATDLEQALAACADVTAWTTLDASAWWRDRAGAVLALAAPVRRVGMSASGHKTIAVDLRGRSPT